jgi:hypothetical protein
MPFLTLYIERTTLSGLGYTSSMDDLDMETVTSLMHIHGEIKKQEKEATESKKKGRKHG